jgi:hypothetical protein
MVGGQKANPAASMVTTAASVFCEPVPPEKAKDKKLQKDAAACRKVFETAAERCRTLIEGGGSEPGVDGIKSCINKYRKGPFDRAHVLTGKGKAAFSEKQFKMMQQAVDRTPPPPPPPPPKKEEPPKPKAKPFDPARSCPEGSECAKAFRKTRLAIYSVYADDADERAAATKKYITFPNDFDSSDEVYKKAEISESTHAAMEEAKVKGTWKGRSLGSKAAADSDEDEKSEDAAPAKKSKKAAPKEDVDEEEGAEEPEKSKAPAKKEKKSAPKEDVDEEGEAEKPKKSKSSTKKKMEECGDMEAVIKKRFEKELKKVDTKLHEEDKAFLGLLLVKWFSQLASQMEAEGGEFEEASCEDGERVSLKFMEKVMSVGKKLAELKDDREEAASLKKKIAKISVKLVKDGKRPDIEFSR